MKKNFLKVVCLVLVAMMIVPFMFSCDTKNYTKNNTVIKIGVSGPLTGGAAIYGNAVKNAAKLAVDEINAAGGLDGIKFELMVYNDEHNKDNIPANYADMYEKGVQITLGTVTTAPGIEFKNYSEEDKVFALTPSATGDDIPGDYTFQMCFADSNQGAVSANIFNTEAQYAGKKIGVFYKSDDEYSKGIRDQFYATLNADFKATYVEQSFTKENESDFATQVQGLKDCDIIFLPIYCEPASTFIKEGKDVMKADAIYYGCDGLDGIDAMEGFDVNEIPQQISYLSHFVSSATTGAAKVFIDKYNAAYDESKEPLNQFGAAAYDCVYAIYEALKFAKANGKEFSVTSTPEEFSEILVDVFTNDSFVFHGVTGAAEADGKSNITWNDDGTVNKLPVSYIVAKD